MSPRNFAAFVGVLAAAAFASANLGCGGESPTPPPPPITISLDNSSATLFEKTSLQFTATLVNDVSAKGVNWTVSCSASACGSASPSTTATAVPTTYTAPGPPASDLTVTLKATAVADPAKSASATITVPALSISISPTSATVQVAASLPIYGTVNNDSEGGNLNWTLLQNGTHCSPGCGTVSPDSGASTTYTAPATPPASDTTVTLTGTSATDATKSASATLLIPSIGISVVPPTPTVLGTKSVQLTATLVNDKSNQGVNWALSCLSPPCGTLSSTNGIATTYTAPDPPNIDNQVTVTATSAANSNAFASALVTVPAIVVTVDPPGPLVLATMAQALTVTVTNDPKDAGVNWSVSCSENSCGTVAPMVTGGSSGSVTYTAPALPSSDLTVLVTATSVTNAANFFQASVTVPAILVSAVQPASGIIPINAKPQFTASISFDPSGHGLNWTVTQNGSDCSPGCGTMNPASTSTDPGASSFNGPATLPANTSLSVNAVSASDATKFSSAAITLTGGTVQLIPAGLSFSCKAPPSTVRPCPPPTQNVVLTNTGATTLSITGTSTTGPFSQTNDCAGSVLPGKMCTVTVTFTSKTVGTHTGTVTLTDTSSDSPQQVTLSGEVIRSRLANADQARAALSFTNSCTVPAPTGSNAVGTRVLDLVDATRKDSYSPTGAMRELSIRVWYPVSTHFSQPCRMAQYTSPKVWEYFAQLVDVQSFAVATNSCQDATVAEGAHPVVVFSPGLTGTFTDYTFLMEDLASRGYIAVAVNHTYEATAVEFSDGRFVRSVVGSHLGGPVPHDHKTTSVALDVRLKDLAFVIDQIGRLDVRRDSPFRGRFDLAKIAVAGHSLGGLTALLTSQSDPHVKTAILMDPVLPESLPGSSNKAVLLMTADRQHWAANECALWSNLHGSRLAVSLQGSEHVALSDWIWLAKDSVRVGPMGPNKTMSAMRDYVAAFLDANLRGDGALNGQSLDYPDARVTGRDQSLCAKP